MNSHRRLQLILALTHAQSAITQAMLLILEDDDACPRNVVKETDKTSPRTPFKPTPPRPSQNVTSPNTVYAFTAQSAREHLRRAFLQATTVEERNKVRDTAKKLVAQGLVTREDADEALKLPPGK